MEPIDEAPLNPYEQQRAERIARNQKVLEDMGILRQATLFEAGFRASKNAGGASGKRVSKKDKPRPDTPIQRRTSARLAELPPANEGLTGAEVEKHGRLVLEEAVADPEHEARWMEYCNRHRCDSQSRGSVYDSKAGICCHFCRQKKLCGEEGCERCSKRDPDLPCIGKSECSRCHSAQGRFCRACLLVRYGLKLEDVLAAADTWLCPHCHEEDHPEEGWICNSSICMTRRGMKPTGIAIFEAQQKGFPFVAHFLQAQILARTSKKAPQAPASAAQLAESTASAAGLPPAVPAAAAKAGRRAKKPPVASAPPRKAETLPAKSPEKVLLTSEEDRRKAQDSVGPPESLLAKSLKKVVLEHVEVKGAAKTESPGRPAHAPGTPKLVTPVKRPLSADLPRSEGRVLRRQSLQDKMHTMTPGASKATGAAAEPAARMTRAACRKLAVAG